MSIADDLKAEVCGGCEHADLRTPYCDICRADAFVPVVAELEAIVRELAAWEPEPYACICAGVVTPEREHVHTTDCLVNRAREVIR